MIALSKLESWYVDQCDGHWEHTYGVKIETLDNPGWNLTIDLAGTELEGKSFARQSFGMDNNEGDNRWLFCEVSGDKFSGGAGPRQLNELIDVFVQWSEQCNLDANA